MMSSTTSTTETGESGEREVFSGVCSDNEPRHKLKADDDAGLEPDGKRLSNGKTRGATYDGNVCLICGDKASGLHYGVLACEGCKGFFKRVCKEKLDSASENRRHCLFGGNCEISMRTRNRCQHCRIQKCIDLGMSKDGIKLGRRSKNFKHNLDTRQQQQQAVSSGKNGAPSGLSLVSQAIAVQTPETGKQLIGIIQDNALIFKSVDVISSAESSKLDTLVAKSGLGSSSLTNLGSTGSSALILNNSPSAILMINTPSQTVTETSESDQNVGSGGRSYPILIYQQPSSSSVVQPTSSQLAASTESGPETSIYSMLNESEVSNIVQATYQAYKETTFDYLANGESAETPIEQDCARGHEALRHLFSRGVIEFLKGSKFLDHFNVLIENAVLFAKNTPYFMNINETDRITLLKSCVFQVICVRHSSYFFSNSSQLRSSAPSQEEMVELATYALIAPAALTDRFLIPIYNSYVTRTWFREHLPRLSTLINLLFDFYKHFQVFELNDVERSLFCAFLLFNTDNSTLVDFSDLINYRELFGDIFLNTLAKKLTSPRPASFKETSSQIRVWMTECYAKLKQIDVEHAKLLNEYKSFVVWPDLYSELYNL